MSILKRQVNSSLDFSSFFSVMHISPLYIFSPYIFNFGQKDPMKVPILTFSSVLMKICQIYHVIFPSQVSFSSNFAWLFSVLFCTFLGQTFYTLYKRDQSKCKFFRVFSTWIKIHQIFVIFETKIGFSFKFCTTLWYHET